LAIVTVKEKTSRFFVGLLILTILFVLPTLLGRLPFQLNIPFLSTAQPSRLIMIIDFCLAVLAGFGLDYFLKNRPKTKVISKVFIFLIICLWITALVTNNQIGLRNLIWPTVLIILTVILISKSKLIWLLSIVMLFDLGRFAIKFESFSDKKWLYPPTTITNFLQEQNKKDVFRIAAVDDRIMPPNFSASYRLQTISGYDPLYLRRYGEFIAAVERGKPDNSAPFGFNRIITPGNYSSKFFDLLGVKYVLSFSDINNEKYKYIFSEGETRLYENIKICPRAFFAQSVARIDDDVDVIKAMYSSEFNPCEDAIITRASFTPNKTAQGKAVITNYQANEILISVEVNNDGDGYLILTDTYYPGWKAEIDGQITEIFSTDYIFRGIKVPSGVHNIRFYYTI